MVTFRKYLVFILALTLLIASLAWAQTTFGVIRGRVLDPTGAAVPKVNVVVTNTGTGIAKTIVSNETGAYEAGYLQPGTYSVTAEAAGFLISSLFQPRKKLKDLSDSLTSNCFKALRSKWTIFLSRSFCGSISSFLTKSSLILKTASRLSSFA